ncbi:hypothetical protein CPLU01_03762 [Colletotrichum plurivorum]|uniref:Uncharacterized protein n=1 Tax=Colletotrichum plurivorum TaxID=2175906 RepID=A0A8H6KRB2_9PEZI|nr:hypothetical protein CPLU01_03762 [Colletotrichum plurivorum]
MALFPSYCARMAGQVLFADTKRYLDNSSHGPNEGEGEGEAMDESGPFRQDALDTRSRIWATYNITERETHIRKTRHRSGREKSNRWSVRHSIKHPSSQAPAESTISTSSLVIHSLSKFSLERDIQCYWTSGPRACSVLLTASASRILRHMQTPPPARFRRGSGAFIPLQDFSRPFPTLHLSPTMRKEQPRGLECLPPGARERCFHQTSDKGGLLPQVQWPTSWATPLECGPPALVPLLSHPSPVTFLSTPTLIPRTVATRPKIDGIQHPFLRLSLDPAHLLCVFFSPTARTTLRASTASGLDMQDCISSSLLTGTNADWSRSWVALGPAPFVSQCPLLWHERERRRGTIPQLGTAPSLETQPDPALSFDVVVLFIDLRPLRPAVVEIQTLFSNWNVNGASRPFFSQGHDDWPEHRGTNLPDFAVKLGIDAPSVPFAAICNFRNGI